mgnify:CR=1 FL=1
MYSYFGYRILFQLYILIFIVYAIILGIFLLIVYKVVNFLFIRKLKNPSKIENAFSNLILQAYIIFAFIGAVVLIYELVSQIL